jgi:glutamate--cysteine ligase catalytic subunit
MNKSRYESVERYISNHWYNRPEYNDMKPLYDEAIFERLSKAGESHRSVILRIP